MKLYRARSAIHGIGLFAGEEIQMGDNILLAFTQINYEDLCSVFNTEYIFHSIYPNSKFMSIGIDCYLMIFLFF